MTRSTARSLATDWSFWLAILLFAVSILVVAGTLPQDLIPVVCGVVVADVLFRNRENLRAMLRR
jgi:hypothetical protein